MASFLPVAAFRLAKLTHAPDLVWLAGAVGLEPRPGPIPASTLEAPLWARRPHVRGAVRRLSGRSPSTAAGCRSSASARHSSTASATPTTPSSALTTTPRRCACPGTAGWPTWAPSASASTTGTQPQPPLPRGPRWTSSPAPGYLGGGDERERLGLSGGPELVVTNLCVAGFRAAQQAHAAAVRAPGGDNRAVLEATGFRPVLPPGDVPTTPEPTAEQVRLIREVIDPHGMRRREFRAR